MKNEVGKYVRSRDNKILKIGKIHKIASRPQYLIEVGDLVEFIFPNNIDKRELGAVIEVSEDYIHTYMAVVRRKLITKIYTQNKDNTGYMLQWRLK